MSDDRTATTEAIEAFMAVYFDKPEAVGTTARYHWERLFASFVAALSGDLCARLATEKGALREVEVMGHNVRVFDAADPDDDNPALPADSPLYRIVPPETAT